MRNHLLLREYNIKIKVACNKLPKCSCFTFSQNESIEWITRKSKETKTEKHPNLSNIYSETTVYLTIAKLKPSWRRGTVIEQWLHHLWGTEEVGPGGALGQAGVRVTEDRGEGEEGCPKISELTRNLSVAQTSRWIARMNAWWNQSGCRLEAMCVSVICSRGFSCAWKEKGKQPYLFNFFFFLSFCVCSIWLVGCSLQSEVAQILKRCYDWEWHTLHCALSSETSWRCRD